MDSVGITIEHLQLLGVQPRLLDEFGGAEPVLEGGASVQVSHAGLDECPQIPRRPVGELHDPAGLALEEDHVAPANVACLHRIQLPVADGLVWR